MPGTRGRSRRCSLGRQPRCGWDAWTRSPLKATKNPVPHLRCLFAVHKSPEAAAWSVRITGAGVEPRMEERTRTSEPGTCCGRPVLFGVEGNGGRGASFMHALGAAPQQRWLVGAAMLRGRSDSPSPGSGRGWSRDASSARSVKLNRWVASFNSYSDFIPLFVLGLVLSNYILVVLTACAKRANRRVVERN
jgi:hypothetical protein